MEASDWDIYKFFILRQGIKETWLSCFCFLNEVYSQIKVFRINKWIWIHKRHIIFIFLKICFAFLTLWLQYVPRVVHELPCSSHSGTFQLAKWIWSGLIFLIPDHLSFCNHNKINRLVTYSANENTPIRLHYIIPNSPF